MPKQAPRGPAKGFDVTPPGKPRPAGLSGQQKAMLALGLLAVLGAVAFAADWMSAKHGYTPSGGYEKLEDRQEPAQAPGAVAPVGNGTEAAPLPAPPDLP